MIPAAHALRASLATKLWSIDRKSHVMALAADPGLALFSGLPATPKKSFLSEYSSRIHHAKTMRLLSAWHAHLAGEKLFDGSSFNLDFHSVPYFEEHPLVEPHFVAMRSRSQPSVLAFMAHDAESRAFCYANADLRKGEEADEVFRFIKFWKSAHGELPRHLVFDSKLTTYANLARLHEMGITFITLRRRTHKLLAEVAALPPSAWRTITLDVPTRKYKTPRIFEQTSDSQESPCASCSCKISVTTNPRSCSPTTARLPQNSSTATPSACSSKMLCPMRFASFTWTPSRPPWDSRSTST
jgi:hypothetical protein